MDVIDTGSGGATARDPVLYMSGRRDRRRDGRAREDYHDPTAGFAGAPPARSALTLRSLLAGFGLVLCTAATVLFARAGAGPALLALFAFLALVALVDLVVVLRRKRRGEPG